MGAVPDIGEVAAPETYHQLLKRLHGIYIILIPLCYCYSVILLNALLM